MIASKFPNQQDRIEIFQSFLFSKSTGEQLSAAEAEEQEKKSLLEDIEDVTDIGQGLLNLLTTICSRYTRAKKLLAESTKDIDKMIQEKEQQYDQLKAKLLDFHKSVEGKNFHEVSMLAGLEQSHCLSRELIIFNNTHPGHQKEETDVFRFFADLECTTKEQVE